MKRTILLVLLALAVPMAAFANQTDFTNHGGKLTGSSAGLSLSGSELTEVDGLGGMGLITGQLGSLTFTTGSLASGSLQMGATFNPGGTFVITGNGTNGVYNGVIFSGTFTGPVTWTMSRLANGGYSYTLIGTISGKLYTGQVVYGAVTELTFNSYHKGGWYNGLGIASGDTNVATTVPEPGTLGLLGTGLLGLAGVLRRRLRA